MSPYHPLKTKVTFSISVLKVNMKHYVVLLLLIISVQCMPNSRVTRQADDYDDGMAFESNGKGGDDDFIANSSSCPAGMTRAPWGVCIPCYEYQQKFGRPGGNC